MTWRPLNPTWYDAFVDRFTRARPRTPEAAFREQTLMVHEWRRFPFVDPELPEALTVACWEMRTTGIAPPPPPWTAQDLLPRHRIRGFDRSGVRATYDMEHRLLHLYEPGARAVTCPRCDSTHTELTSEYGATACKALYRCADCLEPFEHVKEI